MPIVDLNDKESIKNSHWWIGAKTREDWYLKQGDHWYIFRDGKLQRPKAPKGNPSSQTLIKDGKSISIWKLHGMWIMAGILGISLALNLLILLMLL